MSESGNKDQLYADPSMETGEFQFDDKVARVFSDMVRRSIPCYSNLVSMIGEIAGRQVEAGSTCYDLGCSLGAVTIAMRAAIRSPDCLLVAVDNSLSMILECKRALGSAAAGPPVALLCADIRDVRVRNASLVVLNFTLQFIPLRERFDLIKSIHDGLVPGGMLVLSEKVNCPDDYLEDLYTDIHRRFKRSMGYSDLEIARKRAALEKVLIPESLAEHGERLEKAGYRRTDIWFQCLNFASIISRK